MTDDNESGLSGLLTQAEAEEVIEEFSQGPPAAIATHEEVLRGLGHTGQIEVCDDISKVVDAIMTIGTGNVSVDFIHRYFSGKRYRTDRSFGMSVGVYNGNKHLEYSDVPLEENSTKSPVHDNKTNCDFLIGMARFFDSDISLKGVADELLERYSVNPVSNGITTFSDNGQPYALRFIKSGFHEELTFATITNGERYRLKLISDSY